jgi:hypothetical protein
MLNRSAPTPLPSLVLTETETAVLARLVNVMWRGLSRLTDIMLGAEIGAEMWVIESFAGPLRGSGTAHGLLRRCAPRNDGGK